MVDVNNHMFARAASKLILVALLLVATDTLARKYKTYIIKNVWKYYASESFYDSYEKDFMNRQVHAHFFLRQGHYLFMANQPSLGHKYFKRASSVGYRDAVVHSAIAGLLTDQGFYDEAREKT